MIRLPTQNDLLSIGHVYCEAWKAAYKGIVPDDFLDGLTDENCAPRSHRPDSALVCEDRGKIIGVVCFGALRDKNTPQTGEIYSLYVLPEYWRKGSGRALFDAAKEQLRASGYETLFLWALVENVRARRFYEKMGMTVISSRTIIIGGKQLNETGYIQTLI